MVFNDSRGGYIDNVNSTFTRRSTDLGFARRTAGRVPTDSVVVNNDFIAGKDINPVTYKGARLGLDYQVNDDWSVLLTQTYQDMNTSGVFYELPFSSECPTPSNATTCSIGANGIVQGVPLKPLQVTIFNDGKTTDKFSNTALTVNGKVGSLDLVYTGAFLVRDSFQIQDYTNYARGVFGSYYQCTGFAGASVNKCYTPSSTWHDTTHNVNQSHEFRLSTPSDWKVSGIAGVFWEKRKLNDDTEWLYKSVPECSIGGPGSCFLWIDPSAAPKFNDASLNNPGRRVPSTGFFDDFKRTYTQKAAFVSADWHITDSLTLTAGTRYYDIKNEQLGANVGSFYCKVYGAGATKTGPCTGASSGNGDKLAPFGTNLNRQVPNNSKSNGFKSRANLSWKVTDTALVYATWSQGYRPGGFNRGRAGQLRVGREPVAARRGESLRAARRGSPDPRPDRKGWPVSLLPG